MTSRLWLLVKIFLTYVLVFILQKPVFMLCYCVSEKGATIADWFKVIWHGLPLDLSVAGYFSAIPALLLLLYIWCKGNWLKRALKIYFVITAILIALAFILNLVLYDYWRFPLDSTPFFYFFSSPKDAFASVSGWFAILGIVIFALVALLIYLVLRIVCLRWKESKSSRNRVLESIGLLLMIGILFVFIRGGVTVSSMNTGRAYFSEKQAFNHAAVNPLLSALESFTHQNDFASQYRFMSTEKADQLFADLVYTRSDSTQTLLKTRRPDIIMIILESFSSHLMASLGGEPNVAINLDSIAKEGILFTNFYANSFRTDRGLVSILSGYPAQPTMSIMKYPRKSGRLPSIAGSLLKAGYSTKYYYGGDADFTNMRSYLVSSGFSNIVSDVDFPISDRLSKWGVPDDILFDYVFDDLKKQNETEPSFNVVQTSSSHEPFEVNYNRLSDKILNAFAYTDDCVGRFVRRLKETERWQNTLVILVPDHLGAYPRDINNLTPERYQIPLILTGGAISEARRIDVIGSQNDLAATLLGQLGLSHDEFVFSKDMLDVRSPHFAFFTFPDAFGMITTENSLVFDNKLGKTVYDKGELPSANLDRGKAYLQKLYDDINER